MRGLVGGIVRIDSIKSRTERLLHTSTKARPDRKSTRLNSSHSQISYAVFCLKKKKKQPFTNSALSSPPEATDTPLAVWKPYITLSPCIYPPKPGTYADRINCQVPP